MRGALSFLYLTPFLFDMDLPPNLGFQALPQPDQAQSESLLFPFCIGG
jgi:hypothetical protein